ncbi:hypothetical protein GALL_47170 [mine drainage metagenome]|uniref:DUF1573 domain-containing protein n=1 Tax=mine drainage metagenome TaxID=410659 RepID=A0A1J5T085_9ZZZZ
MKRIFFIAVSLFMLNNLKAQTSPAKDINSVFQFSNSEYNFGKIPFGKPVKYDLSIKNIGMDSASLDNVQVGCGCTTPEYEKGKRFGPGQTIKLTLGFNGNTMGAFSKFATLYLSGGYSKVVTFKGETFTTPPPTPASTSTSTQKVKQF